MVKDTPFKAGASALDCGGRRTGSWVRPRPLRKSLGSKACSEFVGVSGISLGLLVGLLIVLEVGGYLDMYLQSLLSRFIAATDNGYVLANRALPLPLPLAKSCTNFHVGILDAMVEVQLHLNAKFLDLPSNSRRCSGAATLSVYDAVSDSSQQRDFNVANWLQPKS